MQDDILMPTLTPREMLYFSARLRLPSSMTDEAAMERVDMVRCCCDCASACQAYHAWPRAAHAQIIDALGLRKCCNTLIGDRVRIQGISGGERKRTSIGVELVGALGA
jgi:ATP-binding cassette subfamily G (WHITE) protein 2